MVHPVRQVFSFPDYIRVERDSDIKHEFLDGEVWAMAGGSPHHARIAATIARLIGAQLEGRRCSVFSSDLRIRVKSTGLATYPDVTVVCDELELDPEDPTQHTLTNPRVLVEVLSPSTEVYDRGEKLEQYRRIPSVHAIVLVAHDQRRIDVWSRSADHADQWQTDTVLGGGVVVLASIACRFSVDDVYRDPLAR